MTQTLDFDEAQRGRIREALRHYMAEQRIGVPALRARIVEADEPRHREIPLSTLQRFLRNSHWTEDHHVALCLAFVKDMPVYDEGRTLGLLGEGLGHFFLGAAAPPGPDPLAPFLGTLDGRAGAGRDQLPPPGIVGTATMPTLGEITVSEAEVTPVPGKPFAVMREMIPDHVHKRGRRQAFEGVLICIAPLYYAVLRSGLTREPRLYSLHAGLASDYGPPVPCLRGRAIAPASAPDPGTPLFETGPEITFYPGNAGARS